MTSTPLADAHERVIDAAGVPLLVTEFPHPGRPAVVLLHGLGSRGSSWWPVIDPLAAHFHLYQLNLRGHGGSGKPESGYAIEQFAADLDAVLDALGVDEPRIMGHSLGGLVTLIWASEHPRRAAALVLEDPPLHTEPEVLGSFDGWQQLAALTLQEAAALYRQEYPDWTDEDCLRRAESITSTAPGVFAELRAASAEALATGTNRPLPLAGRDPVAGSAPAREPQLGGMVDAADAERFAELMPRRRGSFHPERRPQSIATRAIGFCRW